MVHFCVSFRIKENKGENVFQLSLDLSRQDVWLGKRGYIITSVSEAAAHLYQPFCLKHCRAMVTTTTSCLQALDMRSLKMRSTGLPFWSFPALKTPHLYTSTKRLFQKPVSTSKYLCMQKSQFLILFSLTGARKTSVFQDQKWMPEDT